MKSAARPRRPARTKRRGAPATGKPPRPAAGRTPVAKSAAAQAASPASRLIAQRIRELRGWRGETLARMRALIREADPEVTEEWKWDVPVWSHDGIVCTGEAYQQVVKLTFARGASVPDPAGLFNSSLAGNTRRAIDLREGEQVDAGAFKALVRAAVARNRGADARPRRAASGAKAKAGRARARGGARQDAAAKGPVLLSGGNPQIAKADGDAPVQAYIAAMPGWKRAVGERLDALIVRTVPGVRKAVRWNSPMYGLEGRGVFASFHVFDRYVKLTFFRGASLRPAPPGGTGKEARWIDVHEDDLDEAQLAAWVKQAAALPGWVPGRAS